MWRIRENNERSQEDLIETEEEVDKRLVNFILESNDTDLL